MGEINVDELSILIDLYARERELLFMKCRYMELAMNSKFLLSKANNYQMNRLFLYGDNCISMQLYRGLEKMIDIPAVVTNEEGISFNIDGLRVISEVELKKIYKSEFVIISVLENYHEIKSRLRRYISNEKIMFIGEFLT